MTGVVKSQIILAVLSLLVSLSCSQLSSSRRGEARSRQNLLVTPPDSLEFSLANLTQALNDQLNGRRPRPERNPFGRPPNCRRRRNRNFRSIDGTCNNLAKPFLGAAKTPLARLTPSTYEDDVSAPTATQFVSGGAVPEARVISLAIHETTTSISTRHSHLMMNFAQFTDHDITLSPEAGGEGGGEGPKERCCGVARSLWIGDLKECFALQTPDDPIFETDCIPFLRSAPTPGFPGSPRERHQLNDLTAYIDGSQIYGSTRRKARSLRSNRNGKLRNSEGPNGEERLPLARGSRNCLAPQSECLFAAGDVRNSEQAGLTSVHTLFLREHNRIATTLRQRNRRMRNLEIYRITRKIVGAILQRITYREFLPEVLGPQIMRQFDLNLLESGSRFTEYSSNVNPSIVTEFSTAAFRFGHSMVRQTFSTSSSNSIDIQRVFESFKTVNGFGPNALLKGLTIDNMENRDRFVTRGLRDNLFGDEMDLAAFNIQRGRDHALGSYNNIRRSLGLVVHNDFKIMASRTHDPAGIAALQKVYPEPGDVEIFPGGLSEKKLQDAIVGETFAHIIGAQFRKLKFGDRFWHETDDTNIGFSNAQLAEIRKVSLASLFCENVPGASVREYLLVANIASNPTVNCNEIPTMDFSPWDE